MEEQSYDHDKVRNFFEHVALAYEKHQRKQGAHEKLLTHIDKLKQTSLDKKASKRRIEQQFKQLKQHIQLVVALEKEMLAKGDSKLLNKELKSRVSSMEKKFETYTNLIKGRRKRFKDLNLKINKAAKSYENIELAKKIKQNIKPINKTFESNEKDSIKNLLDDLEDRYFSLKLEGASKQELSQIKNKIEQLKKRLI
jgi:hypothetical protein